MTNTAIPSVVVNKKRRSPVSELYAFLIITVTVAIFCLGFMLYDVFNHITNNKVNRDGVTVRLSGLAGDLVSDDGPSERELAEPFVYSKQRIPLVYSRGNWADLVNLGRDIKLQFPPSNDTSSSNPRRKRRVMCTVVRDMTGYLREWVDFHLLVGWDKIVFYDHKSTDNLQEFLRANYPPDLVEYVKIDWPIRPGGLQKMSHAQTESFLRCFQKYWPDAEALTTTDVDEFMFPAREHWDQPDALGGAFRKMNLTTSDQTTVTGRLLCNTFGFGNHTKEPKGSVVSAYTVRAPEKGFDHAENQQALEFERFCTECNWPSLTWCHDKGNWTIPYCRLCRYCVHVPPLDKTLYFPNSGELNVVPKIHWPTFTDRRKIVYPQVHIERRQGIICNHYRFRSFDDVIAKSKRNGASGSLGKIPRNHSYWAIMNSVHDEEIFNFLRARKQVLDEHGIEVI